MEKNKWERLIEKLVKAKFLSSPKVIEAIRSVPRLDFLPDNVKHYSAEDTPLPMNFGQTVSAPHSSKP